MQLQENLRVFQGFKKRRLYKYLKEWKMISEAKCSLGLPSLNILQKGENHLRMKKFCTYKMKIK